MDTAAGIAACAGLVDRIELCAGLDLGGVTPGAGLMQAARDSGLETHVLIRPRTGDFAMDTADLRAACADIAAARRMGLAGVVIGAAQGGALDVAALRQMADAAQDLHLTLHRVIDVLGDPEAALEQVIALGFGRVLTSGGATSAITGAARIRTLQVQAGDRLSVMAGSGVTAKTAATLVAQTGVTDVHASCTSTRPVSAPVGDLGFGTHNRFTDREKVVQLRAALR